MKVSQQFFPEKINQFVAWVSQLSDEEQQEFLEASARNQQLREADVARGDLEIDPLDGHHVWKNQLAFETQQQDPVFLSYFFRWRNDSNITDEEVFAVDNINTDES
jgi:hypothetical protein